MRSKLGRGLLGLLVLLGLVGCATNPQTTQPQVVQVAPEVTAEQFHSVVARQELTDQNVAAVGATAERAFREGREMRREMQEEVKPQLAAQGAELQSLGNRVTELETWRKKFTGKALEMRKQLQKQGATQGSMGQAVRKGELVHGLRNITAWELSWNGDKLAAASEKKLAELQHGLKNGDELVSIVAFCADMKVKPKCDAEGQKAGVVADRIGVAHSFVERQPGKEAVTVAFTVRRSK